MLFPSGIFLGMQWNFAGFVYPAAMYMVIHAGRVCLAATARFLLLHPEVN